MMSDLERVALLVLGAGGGGGGREGGRDGSTNVKTRIIR